jgi:asparagine synthase (glutamine-hydrolysing)
MVRESVVSRSIADVSLEHFSLAVLILLSYLYAWLNNQVLIETFSIGFDEKIFDETDKSRTVAKLINSNHHEFIISEKI